MSATDWQTWVARCEKVLKGNQIESKGYRYTRPAPHVYEHQWLWDSCFHAITYRWFDGQMAQDELLSLTSAQVTTGANAGMIPHMVYWRGDGEALWGQADRSLITQPPLIAIASQLVYERTQDQAFLEAIYPRLTAYHDWFVARRDPDYDHLVSLIHPWESGWDASPRWDAPMGLNSPTDEESKAARHGLVKTLQAHDCNARSLQAAGYFNVESMDFNAIRIADLEALADIADILGKEGQRWRNLAQASRAAAINRFPQGNGLYDLSGVDETPLKTPTVAPLILLFGGCVHTVTVDQLAQSLNEPRFNTPYLVSTTPTNDPNFDPSHYWRGNVWMSVNWLIYRGLRRYGYHELASRVAQSSLALVEAHGFHEYFNPITGEGYGPAQQSWTTLVLDMLATELNL